MLFSEHLHDDAEIFTAAPAVDSPGRDRIDAAALESGHADLDPIRCIMATVLRLRAKGNHGRDLRERGAAQAAIQKFIMSR